MNIGQMLSKLRGEEDYIRQLPPPSPQLRELFEFLERAKRELVRGRQ